MGSSNMYEICCGDFRMVFTWINDINAYGYSLWVRDGEEWKQISDAGNPLVRGKSFDLFPQRIETDANGGKIHVSGVKRNVCTGSGACDYAWSGSITADKETGWLHIGIELSLDDDISLQMTDGIEPEIVVNMGKLPPYERGDHVWFKTSITGPTKWNDDAYGNDFPAVYYYDPYGKYQIMMFFNMTAMSWMSRSNIARFLSYRCSHRRVYGNPDRMEIGLTAHGFSGKVFPKGWQRFEYCIQAHPAHNQITEQDAVSVLVDECLKLLPAREEWHPNAAGWRSSHMDAQMSCWMRNHPGQISTA